MSFFKAVIHVQEHARDRKQNLKMVKHQSVGTALAGGGEPTSYASEEHSLGMVVKAVSEIAHSRRLQKETCTTSSRSVLLRAGTPVVLWCRWPSWAF